MPQANNTERSINLQLCEWGVWRQRTVSMHDGLRDGCEWSSLCEVCGWVLPHLNRRLQRCVQLFRMLKFPPLTLSSIACGQGCQRCADTTGVCSSCKSGFVQDNADRTKCSPPTQSTQSGQICPSGSFASGNQCVACDNACETCSGLGANACTTCTRGQFLVNGVCVGVNSDGICAGTNMIADNLKRECDSKST